MSLTRKRVTFSNLNISFECNPLFAMFVYPLNCNGGADPRCVSTPALVQFGLSLCSIPIQQETLFVYNDNGTASPGWTSINITSPFDSMADYRMQVDIKFHNTTLCRMTGSPSAAPSHGLSSLAPSDAPTGTTGSSTSVPSRVPSSTPLTTNPTGARTSFTFAPSNTVSQHPSFPSTSTTGSSNVLSSSPPTTTLVDDVWTDDVWLVASVVTAAATVLTLLCIVVYVIRRRHSKRKAKAIEQAIAMSINKPKSAQKSDNLEVEEVVLDKEIFAITSEGPGDIVNDEIVVNEEDSFDRMFVANVGEDSVSNSNQKETLQHGSTEGADAQEVRFHGT
eukprot:730198_1